MDLVRDVLDKQLVGHHQQPMGRADSIVIELREGKPPRVVRIEAGLPAALRRIHPRLGKLASAIGRRWGVRRGRVFRIPWLRIKHVGIEVELRLHADRTPPNAWETWLKRHFTRHVPGAYRK